MSATRAVPSGLSAVLLLSLALGAAPAAVANGSTPGARIGELQRAGRFAEALALLETELAARPGDPLLLYNRACLENRLGNGVAAVSALADALAAGFDDLAYAAADPDLAQGTAAGQLARLIAGQRQQRGEMSRRRGAALAFDVPQTLALEPAPGAGAPDGARVTVTWRANGLQLRLEAADAAGRWFDGRSGSPWEGSSGLVVVLGPQADDGTGETSDAFVFGFGLEKGAGVGALYVPAAGGWQRVRELEPKIRGAATERLVVDLTLPWSALAPYHPLVDPALGLNVALVGRNGAVGPRLMPAHVLERPGDARHATARLDFAAATASHGTLQGRTPSSLVHGGQAALNLVAVSTRAGNGTLTLDFQDAEGHSLVAEATGAQVVALEAGVTPINRGIDFSQVRPGPCRASAELAFPDGSRATWSTWLLNLGPAWEDRLREAMAPLPADEKPTAAYFLARTAEAVATHRDRRDPGALTTTLGDLYLMLARFAATGSLVPAEGLSPFVYPGPGGEDRLCYLVLPPNRPDGAVVRPVVLAGHTAGEAPRLAQRLVRQAAAGGATADRARPDAGAWPVFVVAPGWSDTADVAAELAACAGWARTRFTAPDLRLAVQAGAVRAGLRAAAGPAATLAGMMVFADPAGNPGVFRSGEAFGPPPGGLVVDWVEFRGDAAPGVAPPALAQSLATAGWNLRRQEVAGGASFTQVADRAWRWACQGPAGR